MREIRLYGSEGGGAARSPYPYQTALGYITRLRARGALPGPAGKIEDGTSTLPGIRHPISRFPLSRK